MTRNLAPAILLLVGSAACVEVDGTEAELLVPDDVALHWDRTFNGEGDDRVALIPVDLMVYSRESGEPVGDVELVVEPGFDGVVVLPFGDVLPVEADDCDGCLWDAWRDRYVELDDGTDSTWVAEPLRTDANGLARAYVLVDAFPELSATAGDFDSVPVTVSMGLTESDFHLVPQ